MRALRFLLLATLLAPALGCKWLEDIKNSPSRRSGGKPIEDVQPERLVKHLNNCAESLRSLEYSDTRMRVSGKGIPVPATLDGSLAAAQPRMFRMVSTARIADAKIDMGSNPQEFWVYVATPREEPTYLYASHTDFETGRARMPGGIPFEPDWVMQALGLTTYPAGNSYAVKISERDRTYTLSWPATTANGTVIKEVVFDADAAIGTHPQVMKHVLRNAKTNAVIATAEIKSVQRETVGVIRDGKTPAPIEYPTRIVLRWEDPHFELDLNLDKATVNQSPMDDPSRRNLFVRPNINGARAIDLASGSNFR